MQRDMEKEMQSGMQSESQRKSKVTCIHLYCGDGKGKTTAAIGLSIRAAGAGKRVLFSQFMKGGSSSELSILEMLPNVRIMRSEKEFPFYMSMTEEQKQEQTEIHDAMLDCIISLVKHENREYTEAIQVIEDPTCDVWWPDVIIMDEVTYPYNWGLLNRERFDELLQCVKGSVELVMTGRDPADEFVAVADYVTEMKKQKHPYEKGITARVGIEL